MTGYPDWFDDDAHEACVECDKPLDVEDPRQDCFCSKTCADVYCARQRADDDALAAAIDEARKYADEYQRTKHLYLH